MQTLLLAHGNIMYNASIHDDIVENYTYVMVAQGSVFLDSNLVKYSFDWMILTRVILTSRHCAGFSKSLPWIALAAPDMTV